MKKSIALIIVLLIITVSSCEKLVDTSWVSYNETNCNDPWGNSDVENQKKIDNIEKYFKNKKIKIFKTEILHDGIADPCDACDCKSGIRIKCKIKSKDKAKMIAVNFYE